MALVKKTKRNKINMNILTLISSKCMKRSSRKQEKNESFILMKMKHSKSRNYTILVSLKNTKRERHTHTETSK